MIKWICNSGIVITILLFFELEPPTKNVGGYRKNDRTCVEVFLVKKNYWVISNGGRIIISYDFQFQEGSLPVSPECSVFSAVEDTEGKWI